MATATTRRAESTLPPVAALYVAFELGETQWKLASTLGLAQRPRVRVVRARDLAAVDAELAAAKARFALPATAPIVSCYEAGREGFWLDRALHARGIANHVVDAASIEVNRRARRAKADRLDAEKLALMLVRAALGDRRVWHCVRVPTEAEEDARQLQRELRALAEDRTRLTNRIHSLLATQGVALALTGDVPSALRAVRRWDGTALPEALRARLEREWAVVTSLTTRLGALTRARRAALRGGTDRAAQQMRTLARLRGVADAIATTLVRECFGWRQIRNGRELGALAGLTPTPLQSGAHHREQGISRAGNRYVRHIAGELAWLWLRFQPESTLSQWYQSRFASGGPVARRIGIVALARKLLIALWRYLETGVVPAGAVLKA